MAGVEGSSDSDLFTATRPKSRGSRHRNSNNNNAVDALSSTLQDTNRNLRTVDKMLDCYKDYGEQQSSAMDKLRDDLARTTERLRTEKAKKARRETSRSPARAQRDHSGRRYPTSPLKDYVYDKAASDNEYEGGISSPSRRRNFRGAVRFHDDMDADESMHELHQSIRDLYSGQMRIEDDMQHSFGRANRFEYESSKTMKAIADSLKKNTVEQRLQSLQSELQSERQLLKQNQSDVGQISTKLHQALKDKRQTKEEVAAIKTRLSVAESEKNVIHNELAKTKNRLFEIDGAKSTLKEQVDDLRRALLRSEEGKQKLKEQLEHQEHYMRERQRKITLEEHDKEYREKEMQRMQEEVKDLRHQLHKSASVLGDIADLRTELDRSEKQRQQLSDHIEVLGKDMEERERQSAKMIHQLQNVSEKFNVAERQRAQLEDNLEEAIKKLKETSKQAESTASSFRDTQQQLITSEQKNQELKFRAQETVRQWKAKCKKLEKELSMYQHSAEQASTRSERLITELEMTKNQSSLTAQQIEHLKREFNTLLAIRAQQEEEVRVRDVQVNELKSFKGDLERDLRDCKVVIERLEHELLMAREKSSAFFEDKNKYEDSMRGLQQSSVLAQSQLTQLQREVKELNLVRVELSAQLATASSEKGELKAALKEARHNENASREEIDLLLRRIRDNGESHRVMALTHVQKKQQAEYEAELQATRLNLQEEKSNTTLLKRQNEKLKMEIERINSKLATVEEDLAEAQRKYHSVRGEFMSRTEFSEDGMLRSKQLELDLLDQKESLRRATRDHHNVLHTIAAEIDGVVEVATMDSLETYKALSFTKKPSEPGTILAEVKSKLSWLKNEIREMRDEARKKGVRLRSDTKDSFKTNEFDRMGYSKHDVLETRTNDIYGTQDYGTSTYPSANYGTATSTYQPQDYTSGTATHAQDYGVRTATYPNTYDTPTTTYDRKAYGTGTYQTTDFGYTPGTGTYQSGELRTVGSYPEYKTTSSYDPANYGRDTYQSKASTFQSDSRARVPLHSAEYDMDNYPTPISTDGELQMEDLSVLPQRLSQAQVFEAMEKLTSPSESDHDRRTDGSDDSVLQKTQEEREKIHERYAKLQGTLNSLRDELSDAKFEERKPADALHSMRDSRSTTRDSVSTSPSRRSARRVRISSPPTAEFSPVRRSNPSSRESSTHRSSSREREHKSRREREREPSSRERSHSRDKERPSSHSRDKDRSPKRRSSSKDRERSPSRRSKSSEHERSPSRRSHSKERERSSSSHRRHSHERSPSPEARRDRSPKHRDRSSSRHRDRSPSRHRDRSAEAKRSRSRETSPGHRSRRSERSPASPSRDRANPLGLTDEEFNAKFLPKAPPHLDYHVEAVM